MSTIRIGTLEDLDDVVAIYQHEADTGHATFDSGPVDPGPWREKITGTDPFLVAEEDGEVLGFAYASPFRPRAAYHLTKEVTVYLAVAGQGRGLGTLLYEDLLDRLRDAGVHALLAVVALPNDGSLALHARFGFERAGVLREVGDKFDRLIDVALLEKLL